MLPLTAAVFGFLVGIVPFWSFVPPCVGAGGGRGFLLGIADVLGREGGAGVSVQNFVKILSNLKANILIAPSTISTSDTFDWDMALEVNRLVST